MTEKPRPGQPGRPPYKPTIEARQAVEQMKFCGDSDNTIARALKIDPDTLRKHFADELADGHAERRKEIVGLLFEQARNGNVSATKRLEEMGRKPAPSPQAKEPRPAQLGKKDQQRRAADLIGGIFEPGPAPSRIN